MDSLPLRTGFEGPPTTMKGRTEASATQAAVTFLQARHSTPFFLWVSYFSSTSGIEPESKFSALYETKEDARIAPPGHPKSAHPFQWKKYYSWLSSIDEGVGRIIAAVEKSGLMSDTVICFCGDNGLLAGAHGKQGKTWPWEASIRVPLIFAGAGVKQGFVSDQPVSTIDLPETWLDFARVKSFRELPGRSIKATVESGKVVIDDSYSCWCEPNSGLSPPYRLIRTRTHKLIQWQSGETQLFEWLTDPAEQKDLARDPESKKVLGQLKRKLANHMAAEKDPMLRS